LGYNFFCGYFQEVGYLLLLIANILSAATIKKNFSLTILFSIRPNPDAPPPRGLFSRVAASLRPSAPPAQTSMADAEQGTPPGGPSTSRREPSGKDEDTPDKPKASILMTLPRHLFRGGPLITRYAQKIHVQETSLHLSIFLLV
jgi:hypothetical protein